MSNHAFGGASGLRMRPAAAWGRLSAKYSSEFDKKAALGFIEFKPIDEPVDRAAIDAAFFSRLADVPVVSL